MGCDILTHGATPLGLLLVGLGPLFEISLNSVLFTTYSYVIGTVLFAAFVPFKSEVCNGRSRYWLDLGLVLLHVLIYISLRMTLPLVSKYISLDNIDGCTALITCVAVLWRKQAPQLLQDHNMPHIVEGERERIQSETRGAIATLVMLGLT